MSKDIQKMIELAIDKYKDFYREGRLPTYIPALSEANPEDIGVYVSDIEGNNYYAGAYEKKFTIQSISKIITLALAIMDNGVEDVFSKVGFEPTGGSFNSILEMEKSDSPKPFNPMINAGAILVTSTIKGKSNAEKISRIVDFYRKLTGNAHLTMDNKVYTSEKETGHRNRAMTYYMKDAKIIQGDAEEILDLYFQQCSILVNCRDLARIANVFANDGVIAGTGEEVIPQNIVKKVRTLMVTCGMYDASGEFAVRVGLPAKSGVGGGIMALAPQKMGIGIYGPALEGKGNSVVGMKVLEELSKELNLSIF